jgi:hypothetical protein
MFYSTSPKCDEGKFGSDQIKPWIVTVACRWRSTLKHGFSFQVQRQPSGLGVPISAAKQFQLEKIMFSNPRQYAT